MWRNLWRMYVLYSSPWIKILVICTWRKFWANNWMSILNICRVQKKFEKKIFLINVGWLFLLSLLKDRSVSRSLLVFFFVFPIKYLFLMWGLKKKRFFRLFIASSSVWGEGICEGVPEGDLWKFWGWNT